MAEQLAIDGGTTVLTRSDYQNWPVITDDDRRLVNEVLDSGIVAGGTAPLVARAQTHFDAGEGLKALRLLDVAKAAGPETAPALALRLTILEGMLARSVATHDNMSESGILRAMVGHTKRSLESAPD